MTGSLHLYLHVSLQLEAAAGKCDVRRVVLSDECLLAMLNTCF